MDDTATRTQFVGTSIKPGKTPEQIKLIVSEIGVKTPAEILAGVPIADYRRDPGDVMRYGAIGDGVTLDQVAIQAAFTIGGNIIIPDGFNFLVNSRITGVSNTYVSGRGTISGTQNDYLIHWGNSSDVHIRDVRFVGNASSSTAQHAISLEGVRSFSIRGCRFYQLSGRGCRIAYDYGNSVAPENGVIANNIIEEDRKSVV